MEIVIFIVLGVGLLIALVWLIRAILFKREIVQEFRRCNVLVAGKKGAGKDLLFQEVIYKRHKPYYANIDYGGKFTRVTCGDVSVFPNTYADFIKDKVEVVERRFAERRDIYISDGGIFLPSYMDSTLYKSFPSFPIYYALSRHLADHNVHVNVQNFGRLWKALREQADSYMLVHKTLRLPFFLLVDVTIYDKYQSAEEGLDPIKVRMFKTKETSDEYHALHGYIKRGWVIIPKRHIRYNTRAFEKVLYGDAPRIVERPKKSGSVSPITRLRSLLARSPLRAKGHKPKSK